MGRPQVAGSGGLRVQFLRLTDLAFDALLARKIPGGLSAAFGPVKVGLMIAGLEVPHTHVHVVPIRGVHDLDFANAAAAVPPGELAAAAERIRVALRDAGAAGVADT